MAVTSSKTALLAMLLAAAAACGGKSSTPSVAPAPASALTGLIDQPLAITPVQRAIWPGSADFRDLVDSALIQALKTRGPGANWVFSDALVRSYARNRTYAQDPRALSVESLRAPRLQPNTRVAEPLATQLRTMVALQEGRLVLIPVDVSMDSTATETRGLARLVLIDVRRSEIVWTGEVKTEPAPGAGAAAAAAIASKIAALFQ